MKEGSSLFSNVSTAVNGQCYALFNMLDSFAVRGYRFVEGRSVRPVDWVGQGHQVSDLVTVRKVYTFWIPPCIRVCV